MKNTIALFIICIFINKLANYVFFIKYCYFFLVIKTFSCFLFPKFYIKKYY